MVIKRFFVLIKFFDLTSRNCLFSLFLPVILALVWLNLTLPVLLAVDIVGESHLGKVLILILMFFFI